MASNNAKMTDLDLFIQAGIDPKTKLPIKFSKGNTTLKTDTKRMLRLIDEQDAVNRYVWYNIPCNLTSQDIERMLYYKGQLCFFYMEDLDEFYFMPYALDGTIDFYGRFNTIHPVPMTSGNEDDDKGYKAQAELLSNIKLKCVYAPILPDNLDMETFTKSAVILKDYTNQMSQTIIPRATVNDSLLDAMADCIPFMHTSLMLNSGIKGVRVGDSDQAQSVYEASDSIYRSALTGKPWVPITSALEFQELGNNGGQSKSEEFMMALQSLDNFRLSTYGIDNGGLFDKKAYVNNAQTQVGAGGAIGLTLQDGAKWRQDFCNIVNSIWGVGLWCEPSENITLMDTNGDGVLYDNNADGSNSGVEDTNNGGNDNELD